MSATAANVGETPLPCGIGFRPWTDPRDRGLDDRELQLEALRRVQSDARRAPLREAAVRGDFNLAIPRQLAGLSLCDTWVELVRDETGVSATTLARGDSSRP